MAQLIPMRIELIEKIVCSVFALLSECNEPLFPKAVSQLKVIVTRTAQRKARPAVSRLWSNLMTMLFLYGFALSEEPAMVCSTPGCTSLEEAKMACGECKARYYCSRACQKRCVYRQIQNESSPIMLLFFRDWRVHKSECGLSA